MTVKLLPESDERQMNALKSSQQHSWILDQLKPDSAINNISATVHMRRALSTEVLARSLNAMVQRHDALRITVRVLEGQPVQVIAPSLTIPLPVVDLQAPPEAERPIQAQRLATEEAQRPFDLSQGPLVRATLLQLGAEEHVLLLSMHRIICDGWSMGVCLRELASLYEAFASGQPSSLPELPMQFPWFALRQQEWLTADAAAAELAYWKQQLADSPAGLELPSDHPRLPMPTLQGSTHELALPRALSEALRELSQREGVSLYMALVAAFVTLLHRYTGQEDLVIGTVTADGMQADTEPL